MINTIEILKRMDKFLGVALLKIIPGVPHTTGPENKDIKRILVIRPGGMGDAILLLPVLKAAKKEYPEMKIDILCESRNAMIFHGTDFIDSVFLYKSPRSLFSVIKQKYDIIFDTEQSYLLSAVVNRLLRAKMRMGFKTNGRDKFYNDSIPYDQECYESKMFWMLFNRLFDLKTAFGFDFPYFKAAHLLDRYENMVCLFPGATTRIRQWPEARWAEVIDWIAEKGFRPVLLGSFSEKAQCRKIVSLCGSNNIVNMCCKLTIVETATLFDHARLLISTDSGILHLGALCDIPTLSIFGPSSEKKWAPKGGKHIVINKKIGCSPCTLFGTAPPCPNEKRCLMEISKDDILEILNNFFQAIEKKS